MTRTSSRIIECLRGIVWTRFSVDYAVLFGSIVRDHSRAHDIDLAIKFLHKPSLEDIGHVIEVVSEATSIPDVDIVVLNRDDLSCELLREVYCNGVLIYARDYEEYVSDACRRLMICYDYDIMKKKLDTLETALRMVKKRWVS